MDVVIETDPKRRRDRLTSTIYAAWMATPTRKPHASRLPLPRRP
jgi:hypothetical protein